MHVLECFGHVQRIIEPVFGVVSRGTSCQLEEVRGVVSEELFFKLRCKYFKALLAGNQGVERGANGVDVGSGIYLSGVVPLFWCHESQGADHRAGAGEVHVCALYPGNPEVRHFRAAVFGEQDISWLDVAVNDVLLMGDMQCA